MWKIRQVVSLHLIASAVACSTVTTVDVGAHDDVISASSAYTPKVGEVWKFVNGYSDTTTITTVAAPDPVACRSGRNVIWHYEKTSARAYWNPGIDGAVIDFVLHQDPDSSWRSTASVISFPKSCVFCDGATSFTWHILDNAPPTPNGYRITPPTLRRGDRVVYETLADAKGGPNMRVLGCVDPDRGIVALPGHGAQWRTEFYLEDVVTPVYSGPAAVSEQRENCNATFTNPGCGHEKWWFAPGLGLVKVWQINSTAGIENDLDQRLIMVRVK
jgi:hypothetical protein